MAFTNNFRIERIYFEKLKSNIDILKSYIEAGATGEALELLKNSVDVDGAVLLLYRNLGEAWAELADLIQKTQKDLKDLAEKTEAYHYELNERIDEVNNYLMALIRELDARLQVVEQDLATMNRNKFYDLVENDGSYLIEKDGVTVSFDDIKSDSDFPHDVILRYDNGTSVTELEIREFTDSRIDFYSIGLADSDKTVKEILVSIADTEAVTYSENTLENPLYTFGTGLSLDSDNELSVDFNTVQAKLTEGTGIDIDSNNEISVDTNVIQPKLSEGFGIDIDSNNEIKVDTADVQEKLIAGQNITLTPDTTDPTKTVIDASGGGSSYTEGTGIYIDSNNVISSVKGYDITEQIGVLLEEKTGIEFYQQNGHSYNMKTSVSEPFTVSKTDFESWLNTYKDFHLLMFKAGNATSWTYPTAQDFKTSDVRYSVELRYNNGANAHYYPISNSGHGMFYCGKTYLNTNTGVTYSASIMLREALLKLYQTMIENNLNDITLNFVIIPEFIYNGSPQSTAMTSDILGMLSDFTLRVYGIK